ncbi:MAG: type II secretion system major pseudopilin GspG [Kiritimatiellae bacterium]|nr:type II secretion system major pseudopilin GspG [Kiritimatiellia bacterium]
MKNTKSAFTLIELMVVVVIIAALAAMILPHVLPASEEAMVSIARGDIANIKNIGLELYHLHNHAYPSTEEGLMALVRKPSSAKNWKGPYIKKKPDDPWKHQYQYRNPGSRSLTGPDVWSKGPDAKDGSQDDVWPEE